MRHFFVFYSIVALLALSSCEDGNTFSEDYEPSLDIVPYLYLADGNDADLQFVPSASSKEVIVTTYTEYAVRVSANWLTATPSSDMKTLIVNVQENTSTKDRTATVTLTNPTAGLNVTIKVFQEGQTTLPFTLTTNGKTVNFNMKYVEAGTFQMGTSDGKEAETLHTVTLTKDYYMGETEVTQELWYAVTGQIPVSEVMKDYNVTWNSKWGIGNDYPAYAITYNDVNAFLAKLNSLMELQLPAGMVFRMPTEAEWEFAARGGNKSKGYLYAGSNTIGDVAWYELNASSGSSSGNHCVKTKAPNELGLYDMSGNAEEWCFDWYSNTFYTSSPTIDPVNDSSPSANLRIIRGGDWLTRAWGCTVSSRFCRQPEWSDQGLGFRLALGFTYFP